MSIRQPADDFFAVAAEDLPDTVFRIHILIRDFDPVISRRIHSKFPRCPGIRLPVVDDVDIDKFPETFRPEIVFVFSVDHLCVFSSQTAGIVRCDNGKRV